MLSFLYNPAQDPYRQLKLFNLFMYGSWSLLNPYLPVYFQEIGFSNLQIGLLMSIGPLVSLLANPFWGYWSDRLQNIRLIIIFMLIGNLALSQIYFQMHMFITIFILMLLFYFFQTALNPLSNSLILQSIEHTPHQFGTFRLWGSIGFAIMVLIAGPMVVWIGIENLGYLYGTFIVITLWISLKLPRQGKKKKRAFLKATDIALLFKSGIFLAFLLLSMLISLPNRLNLTFISIYIHELGGSEVYVGWSWFLAAIIEVPVFILLDRYLRPVAKTMFGLLAAVSVLYTLRWLLMGWATAPMQIVWIQLLHSVTFGVAYYVGTQLCDYLVPRSLRTSGQAVYGVFWMGIAGLVGGLLGGALYDSTGPTVMYTVCAILSMVGIIGFTLIWFIFSPKSNQDHYKSGPLQE